MSRGRTPRSYPRSDSRSTVRRAAEAALGHREFVEQLEDRRLLTTLTGGQTFIYTDASGGNVEIRLTGNITAEFLAGRATGTRNVVRDLIPGGASAGLDLFSIYVAEAGRNASIYISRITNNGLQPYSGSPGNIGVTTIRTVITTPPPIDAAGDVYIGVRRGNVPVTSIRNSQTLGVRPAGRVVYAGLQTAAGVSLTNFFVGGVITGIVDVEGSVNTFYAGGILTGDTAGLPEGTKPLTTNNFNIAGDLQNFYVGGSVGTNGTYDFRTGTNIRIGGRLGYMHVNGNFYGQVQDRNVVGDSQINTPSVEAETYFVNADSERNSFDIGLLAQSVTGTNETGGLDSQFDYTDGDNEMSWTGTLQTNLGDTVDTYSLPLMAGQTATLELVTSDPNDLTIGVGATLQVLDPTGRVVASDLPGPTGSAANQQFQYTAKIPGVYSLVVTATVGPGTYRLQANAAAPVAIGGVTVSGTTLFKELGSGVAIRTGDLGAWIGNGDIIGTTAVYDGIGAPINISRGNIRAIYSNANLGVPPLFGTTGAAIASGLIDLLVPKGSVGHLRSGGNLLINPSAAFDTNEPVPAAAVAGDYQRVEAGGDLTSNIVADGRIGTIIANTINTTLAPGGTVVGATSIFSANTDERGNDGTIDMIYCANNFGGTGAGGPGLFNGLDGNIKYVYVGGRVFRDSFFGTTVDSQTSLEAGRAINFVDDSGSRALIRPTDTVTTSVPPAGSVPGTTIDPFTGATTVISVNSTTGALTQTVTAPGSLDYIGYGVRGVGGQVMINLHSTTSVSVTSLTAGGQIDIGNITTNATGSAPVIGTLNLDRDTNNDGIPDVLVDVNRGVSTTVGYQPDSTTPPTGGTVIDGSTLTTIAPNLNEITLNGQAPVNVFHIVGATTGTDGSATASTNITSINNFTGGEIVSVDATNLGMITAGTIGLMSGAAATDVEVPGNLANAQPFNAFSRGINVTGPMIGVLARNGIGNVRSNSTINTINPNTDGKNARGVNDGINGAIRANILNVVQIGEGIRFGGSGGVFESGLFAVDTINNVVGNNADIRGPIVANNFINSIVLTDGSIVNTRIGTLSGTTPEVGFAQGSYTATGLLLSDPSSNLGFALNQVLIHGNGGIMGSDLEFGNFANVTVEGYGIIGSEIGSTASNNTDGQIVANGFGIRASTLDVGGSIRTITAAGNGRVLSTASYNSRVNQSGGTRRLRFDPYSGRLLSGLNDLNRYFGTSRTSPRLSGSTNAGVIADTQIVGNGTLGTLNAYAFSTADTTTTVTSPAFPNRLSFSSNIGTINIAHTISGLQLRTGKLDTVNVGTNLQRADIRVSGEIGAINVGGTIRGSTNIVAQNGNGQIGSIVVKGGLYGTITSRGQIGTIGADTIGAQIISTSAGITRVGVTNDVLTGSLIQASRTINRIIIGGDFQNDATIQARDIGVFRVGGANLGDVIDR